MSYTLMVTSPTSVTKAHSQKEVAVIQALPGANRAEVLPSERKGAIVAQLIFHHDTKPADVKVLFDALVRYARKREFAIMDMQSGETIDLDAPRDISREFLPHAYVAEPCLMGQPGDWEIVVGSRGAVGSLRQSANGEIRLVFGDDEDSAVPVSWLLEKIDMIRRG